jgi:transposase
MESTGIYWKSVYASLSAAGIPARVVNARHVKKVPGRKTDVADSERLAQLARFTGARLDKGTVDPISFQLMNRLLRTRMAGSVGTGG